MRVVDDKEVQRVRLLLSKEQQKLTDFRKQASDADVRRSLAWKLVGYIVLILPLLYLYTLPLCDMVSDLFGKTAHVGIQFATFIPNNNRQLLVILMIAVGILFALDIVWWVRRYRAKRLMDDYIVRLDDQVKKIRLLEHNVQKNANDLIVSVNTGKAVVLSKDDIILENDRLLGAGARFFPDGSLSLLDTAKLIVLSAATTLALLIVSNWLCLAIGINSNSVVDMLFGNALREAYGNGTAVHLVVSLLYSITVGVVVLFVAIRRAKALCILDFVVCCIQGTCFLGVILLVLCGMLASGGALIIVVVLILTLRILFNRRSERIDTP